jgi:hypothetical protein
MNTISSSARLALIIFATLVGGSCALGDSITANGDVRTEPRSVSTFSSVTLEGSGTLRVHQGSQDVEITADSNVLPYIQTTVSGSRLSIGIKPFTTIWGNPTLEFDVTLPSLNGVVLSGSGNAVVDPFSGGAFAASITGSGGLSANLAYSSIALDISGSGGAALLGTAGDARLTISGSGGISAKGLTANTAEVGIYGSGNAELRVVSALSGSLSGSGQLRYWGGPAVTANVSGSGQVIKAGN